MSNQHSTLTAAEYRSLLEAATDHSLRHGITVFLLGHTGLTSHEASRFTSDWFDESKNRVTVPEQAGDWSPKSPARVRKIPLQQSSADRLKDYLRVVGDQAFDITPRGIRNRINSVQSNIGVETVSPYVFRRTFISRLIEMGVPKERVQQIAGVDGGWARGSADSKDGTVDLDQYPPLYPDLSSI